MMRSLVTSKAAQLVGALVMTAARVGVVNPSCHSYSLPSVLLHATRYSPQVSRLHVVAGTDPVSGRAVP
jgi:hypothetical protein